MNPLSVVIMDNASIYHVNGVVDPIENQAGARLLFLPPYSPNLNPLEEVFSQVKAIMKQNDQLFQVTTIPRALLIMVFGMVTEEQCRSYITDSGYLYTQHNNEILHCTYCNSINTISVEVPLS